MTETLPHIQIPSAVESFEVRCLVGQFVMDGADDDKTPDLVAVGGSVDIAPDVKTPLRVTEGGVSRIVSHDTLRFTIDPETGALVHPDGTVGVRLLDPHSAALDPKDWTYTATVSPAVGKRWTVTFTGPSSGGVVDLGAVASVAPSPGNAVVPLQEVQAERVLAESARAATESFATTAEGAAIAAAASAEYAATVAYGEPLVVTDATLALVADDGASATRAALDRVYRAHTSVAEYGALGDGVADDTAAVAAALVAGAGGNVYFPPGAYRLTGNLEVPANTTITGAGSAATLLDWSSKAEFDAGFFLSWGQGVFTNATTLTVPCAPGDVTITAPTGHTFVKGDWVRLRADNKLWGEATPAEYQRVLSVAGDVLSLSGPVFDTYTLANNAVIEKAVLPTGGIQSLTIRGKGINAAGYGDTAVRAGLVRDFFVTDVHFYDVENKCILLNSVLGASIADCAFRFDPSFTPLQYGVAATGGCQMITMRGCSSWNDRHMFTTSTSQSLVSETRGVPRVLTITGCTAHGSWQAPIDTHRGGEYITITGNSLSSESTGIKVRSGKVTIVGNSIVGKRTSLGGGARGIYIGMVAEDIRVTGNLVSGFQDGITIDSTDITSRNIAISGNTIVNIRRGVYLGVVAPVAQVQINGNTIRPDAGGQAVFFFAAASDVEIVGNTITGGHTGIWMSHPTNTVNRLLVTGNTIRLQEAYAMFFRWVYDGLVTSNFAPGAEIRFTEECLRVTTGLNQATINDMTTGTTITQK